MYWASKCIGPANVLFIMPHRRQIDTSYHIRYGIYQRENGDKNGKVEGNKSTSKENYDWWIAMSQGLIYSIYYVLYIYIYIWYTYINIYIYIIINIDDEIKSA